MTEKRPWSKAWCFAVDPGKLDIFPLQFANCDRIERHDAVYLFDEVGCGKTISAGLMALHYLYNHPDKDVLVITVNALVTTGKFADDWKKIPFDRLELGDRFNFINNDYRNIEKNSKQSWGLVIIDEAHLFLNLETKRHTALCSLKAEKVVFLTATPVKDFRHFNISVYADIADSILGKKADRKWIDQISTQGKAPEDIICQTFFCDTSVTRYFKDTVKALTIKGYRRSKARWQTPDIWYYTNYKTRFHELAKHIENTLSKEPKARFVVFVRLIDDAKGIGNALAEEGFHEFSEQTADEKSYAVVTGTSKDLSPYCGEHKENESLPTVLIITYQLAEQGVDLPSYSHVVNVHIPAYPSSLEQRFGRIDRMNSNYTEIKMHFFLGKGRFLDSNTINFDTAVLFYLTNLISYLPAKNALLTSEILEESKNTKDEAIKYLTKMQTDVLKWTPGMEGTEQIEKFCQDYGIPWNGEDKTDLEKDIAEKLRTLKKTLAPEFSLDSYSKLLADCTGDKIFYFTQLPENNYLFPSAETVSKNIQFLDAVDCAERINASKVYETYYNEFKSKIEPVIYFTKYQAELEKRYEKLFMENRIEEIFKPNCVFDLEKDARYIFNLDSVYSICREIVSESSKNTKNSENIKGRKNDFPQLVQGLFHCWRRLPFFQLCGVFGEMLRNRCLSSDRKPSDNGPVKRKFQTNHFIDALWNLALGIWTAHQTIFYGYGDKHQRLWLSRRWWTNRLTDDFCEYLEKIRGTAWQENPFYIENKDGKRLASNWLRLVVQLTAATKPVFRQNSEEVSVLDGFLYSESDRRMTGPGSNWWVCAPNLLWSSNEEDWWTHQI